MPLAPELQQSLYNSLRELGITEHEADLYITSLALGPSPLSKIAEQMKISRPNVYKLIAKLEERGLVAIAGRAKYSRAFTVESPAIVLNHLRKKREGMATLDHSLASAMPDLLALFHQGGAPTKIKIIQGEVELKKLFFQILEEEKVQSDFYGSAKDFIGFFSWATEREWIKERNKKGIKIRSLLLPSEEAATLMPDDDKELREIRVVRGLVPFVTGFQLFANKVIIWQPKAPLAVLIEDEYIVAMLKSTFNHLWELSN